MSLTYTSERELKDEMRLRGWRGTDVWQFCAAEPRKWQIKTFADLKPKQINEIVHYMIAHPKS